MNKRTIILLIALCLAAPLMLFGCSGDDGAQGPRGPAGDNGSGGGPGTGVVALETCAACHGAGQPFDVNNMHRLNPTTGNPLSPGSVAVTVTSVVFGAPVGDNVPVTVNFTFAATNQAGVNITPSINLNTASAGALTYLRFTVAKMVPGTLGAANEWDVAVARPGSSGSGPYYANSSAGISGTPATGVYTYVFPDNAVRLSDVGSLDNAVVRVVVEARNFDITLFTADPYYAASERRPVDADAFDSVAPIGGGTGVALTLGDGRPRKNDVSTAACNACHDPLAIHGGSRRDYKYCAACHNAKLEVAFDNANLVNLVHKIHNDQMTGVQAFGELALEENVTYPPDIRDCTKCHQGPDADNTYDNWKNKPTITACTSCHITISFVSPAPAGKTLHTGGARADNSGCVGCHDAAKITAYHATENVTPNNPQLPGTLLVSFQYEIDNVTVNAADNSPLVRFRILSNPTGTFLPVTFNAYTGGDNNAAKLAFVQRGLLTGFSGSPAFLVAYALPQDGISLPADYNNLGKSQGQPASPSIAELQTGNGGSMTGPDAQGFYTATLLQQVSRSTTTGAITSTVNARFPAGATLRAVALQGYFTQIDGGIDVLGDSVDNVARHTFSVVRPVTGDAVRRVAVESGYTNNNNPLTGVPVGCLECHEIFEGHGGNRVSNAQVCVMCHNPNLSTSGRVLTPPLNATLVAKYGSDPLQYPEVSNNFKELIHGLHGRDKRTTNFVDIRGRARFALLEGDEITYPGELSHCGKCHLNNLYQNLQRDEVVEINDENVTLTRLLSTVKTTTGVATETRAQILSAEDTVPNATDLVNSPATSACGHCHDSDVARSHFIAMGGKIRAPRSSAILAPPQLMPMADVTP